MVRCGGCLERINRRFDDWEIKTVTFPNGSEIEIPHHDECPNIMGLEDSQ